jgi:hypothetical protein
LRAPNELAIVAAFEGFAKREKEEAKSKQIEPASPGPPAQTPSLAGDRVLP